MIKNIALLALSAFVSTAAYAENTFVTLDTSFSSDPQCSGSASLGGVTGAGFTIVDGTGTFSPGVFRVPQGETFILTDIEWRINYDGANAATELTLFAPVGVVSSSQFSSPLIEVPAAITRPGYAAGQAHLTTGRAISTAVCGLIGSGATHIPFSRDSQVIYLHGYLTK